MFDEILEDIKDIQEERDSRFSSSVGINFEDDLRDLKRYQKGDLKILASAEDSKYTVQILTNDKMVYLCKSVPDHPVMAGNWMHWWEKDHEKYFGVSSDEYEGMSLEQKAEVEAKLQLKLWVDMEFWSHYAEFYHTEEYDKWWWDEGGARLSARQGFKVANEYWKKRLSNV
jgi:hypothetical protein